MCASSANNGTWIYVFVDTWNGTRAALYDTLNDTWLESDAVIHDAYATGAACAEVFLGANNTFVYILGVCVCVCMCVWHVLFFSHSCTLLHTLCTFWFNTLSVILSYCAKQCRWLEPIFGSIASRRYIVSRGG